MFSNWRRLVVKMSHCSCVSNGSQKQIVSPPGILSSSYPSSNIRTISPMYVLRSILIADRHAFNSSVNIPISPLKHIQLRPIVPTLTPYLRPLVLSALHLRTVLMRSRVPAGPGSWSSTGSRSSPGGTWRCSDWRRAPWCPQGCSHHAPRSRCPAVRSEVKRAG